VLYKGEIRKMPHSYSLGKPEAVDYILKNVSKKAKILDVGPGVGTYSDLLTPHGYVLDGVEIYMGYIKAYDLHNKYRLVFCDDIMTFNTSRYNFIILGDVLEHLEEKDAQSLLGRIGRCLVAVPYLCPQSGVEFEHEGIKLVNPHEEHKQADLTPENMLTRYPALKELWRDEQYGYYVKEK
jgi:hypothetical protein